MGLNRYLDTDIGVHKAGLVMRLISISAGGHRGITI